MTKQKRNRPICNYCYRPIRYLSSAQLVEGRARYYSCPCNNLKIRVIIENYDPRENTKSDK